MGTLFVVATPLGNLDDITPRALETLRRAAIVACEDTRRTRGLLTRFGIRPGRLISCHKFNERARLEPILSALRAGSDVALVSDGGSPGLSDPGAPLIAAALEEGLTVSPIPGPSAVAAAISVCGFPCASFHFAGFLPARAGPRRRAIEALLPIAVPLVLFESPHRVATVAADLLLILGDRPVTLLREMTKLHEEVRRTTLAQLTGSFEDRPARGEFTLVIRGFEEGEAGARDTAQRVEPTDIGRIRERYMRLLDEGVERREALRTLMRETGLPRRDVYRLVMPPAETVVEAEAEEEPS